jgi:ribokinase
MVDVVARLTSPIAPGSDAPARIAFHGGGSAANTAAWLAAAGAHPILVGRIGDDAAGRDAAAQLRDAGVDTRLVIDTEHPTGTCIVLVAPGGERTMVPDPGAGGHLAPEDLTDDLFSPGGHLHVAGYALLRAGSRAAGRSAIVRARALGMTVSLDPSSAALLSEGFLDLADGAGLLVPNRAEATALAGQSVPEHAAARLAKRFPEVVVTLGAAGALWTDGRDTLRVPATRVTGAIDSTGAGDAFTAGLLAARMNGTETADALAAGVELAARAVATPGARP